MTDVPWVNVPMNDLRIQYTALKDQIDTALARVIENCAFIQGPAVQAFEAAFARYCGVAHCVGVSNGTDALKLALAALDVGPGDEVITAPHTFGATVEAILQVGAKPVFVDIEPTHFTFDVGQVEAQITPHTRVLLPVHIYGQMVDMEPLTDLARKHGLRVVEDAAQAHGASYRGRRAGAMGDVGCFSFYPGKNLGAYGDAGGVVTDDADIAARVRALANHGQDPAAKFLYREVGYNHRMDGFQGAVLGVKLPFLEDWNAARRRVAACYDRGFAALEAVTCPAVAGYGEHVYHLYVVRVPDRDALAAELKEAGVQTAVQYPNPLHCTPAYAGLGYGRGTLPECERACAEILSLPMFPDLTTNQVEHVIDRVRAHYGCS